MSEQVRRILRHKNIQQTIEYTKALPRVSKDAARRLSEALA